MSKQDPIKYVTYKEAAERLRMSLPSFNRLMKELKIQPYMRGMYYWPSIERGVESKSRQG